MGILHSTTRFLASYQKVDEEEEDESSVHQDLQNHSISIFCGDSAETARPTFFSSWIFKAIKSLLRRVGSIFSLAKPRKAADPLLPVQYPAASILTQPLILQTPPVSPPPTPCDGEELECDDDVDRVLLWAERNCTAYRNETDHHVAVSIPGFTREEMTRAAVFEEEDASRNVRFLAEVSSTEDEEEEEEEEEVEIKSVIVVSEERWIKHYSSRHRILLVGEGDFSFSACLAVKFQWAPNIIATSLDSQDFLKKNYCNALRNIEELRSRGSKVMHGIDVSSMANDQVLGQLRYDRIVFNFPYAGLSVIKDMPRQSQLWHHQRLVRAFLENAREMISEEGEIHIRHKTNGFHGEWRVASLAGGLRLRLIDAVTFNHLDYPGYNTKCGFGGDKYFNCNPSKTYIFGLQ